MIKKIRIMIVNDNADTRASIKSMLEVFSDYKITGEASNGSEAISMVLKYQPDIVIMEADMPIMDGYDAALKITQVAPYIGIILIGTIESIYVVRKAMQCGAGDFVDLPLSASKISNAVNSLYSIKQEQRKCLIESPLVVPQRRPKVISVFSSKGGVGKTVLATNVAIALKEQTREDILLLDMDLQFGDVSELLNINPRISILDLVEDKENIDLKDVNSYVLSHTSGIKVLPAPQQPEMTKVANEKEVKEILSLFTKAFDYLIVDLAPNFDQITVGTIEMSDYLMVITTMEVPTLKNVKTSIDMLLKLEYPKENILVIINRFHSDDEIKIEEVKRFLGIDKIVCICEAPEYVSSSINMGEPIVTLYKNSEVAKQINDLCMQLIDYRRISRLRGGRSFLKGLFKRRG